MIGALGIIPRQEEDCYMSTIVCTQPGSEPKEWGRAEPSGAPKPSQGAWHEGERVAHARLGLSERMAELGERVLRNFMPDQHRLFFSQLPFLVVGSVDA